MSALDKQEGGSHYKDMAIQPAEFIIKNKISFCEGNVIKYVCRHKTKNGIEDLKKARHYLDMLIEAAEQEDRERLKGSVFSESQTKAFQEAAKRAKETREHHQKYEG